MKVNTVLAQPIHIEFKDAFTCTDCFKGISSLQVSDWTKPHQVPPRCVAYVLQQPFKELLE